MYITNQMEQFSIAYVSALAAKAGCNIFEPRVDNDSIDMSLQKIFDGLPRGRIDIQLKAHGVDHFKTGDFSYTLKKKNYDDLRADEIVPRLLVVVCMPKEIDSWILQSEEQLLLRRCAYWYSLAGFPDNENETSVTIHIPRINILSPEFLEDIMRKSAQGEI